MTQERSVLITGCSSGIGLCTAHGLKNRGYRVFATARKSQDVERLQNEGLESLQLDLVDSSSIQKALNEILILTNGKLYGLFNNGGYGQPGAIEDLSRDVLREQFEVNLFGWHELVCRVLPAMHQQGFGRIIQNSSLLGLVSLAYRGAYNSSKYALEGLTDTLRLELTGTGIFVSLIEPGPILSGFRGNAFEAFNRNIDRLNSRHRDNYAAMDKRFTSEGPTVPFTLPPDAVLKAVIHALENPKPKNHYYVTFPTYFFGILKRLLSSRALDRILRYISDSEIKRK